MPSVLYFGATGYIGGSVLVAIARAHPSITFSAPVRSASQVPLVNAIGSNVVAVHNTLKDPNGTAAHVDQADIVFNTADSDDIAFNEALLSGFKKRKEEGKGVGILIHTSGSALFLDGKKDGKRDGTGKIWTESEEDVKQITPQMLHGQVDHPILNAAKEGYVIAYTVCPSLVVGKGTGPGKKTQGTIRHAYVGRGEAYYVGEGTSIFGLIHMNDVVSLYELVFAHALSQVSSGTLDTSSPYSKFYIASTVDWQWKDIASTYATVLHKLGLLKSPKAVSVDFDTEDFWKSVFGASQLCKAEHAAKELGWRPKYAVTEQVITEGLSA